MRIIFDDAGDVPGSEVEKHDLVMIPVNISFGTEQFLSSVNMQHADFYAKVKTVGAHNFPKTSQPTPFQFEELYRDLIAKGDKEFLTIVVSERLSGTYASAVAAGKELADQATFHLYDSEFGSAPQGMMVMEAARMNAAGADWPSIKERLDEMRREMAVYFLIDSLEYAVKGGRVSSLRSTMASLLNIKPIMNMNEGIIVEAAKVRTYSKALNNIIELTKQQVGDRPVELAVMHAGAPDAGQSLLEMAHQHLNIKQEHLVDMAIAVAINLGPGALGIAAVPVKE